MKSKDYSKLCVEALGYAEKFIPLNPQFMLWTRSEIVNLVTGAYMEAYKKAGLNPLNSRISKQKIIDGYAFKLSNELKTHYNDQCIRGMARDFSKAIKLHNLPLERLASMGFEKGAKTVLDYVIFRLIDELPF